MIATASGTLRGGVLELVLANELRHRAPQEPVR
jgi:hypothetical protein